MSGPVLDVGNLTVDAGSTRLLSEVSFALRPGSRTGLIGESGSGKTITALAVLGLLAEELRASGRIRLNGEDVLDRSESDLVGLRGNAVSMIFQEPMTALNPLARIGNQVAEPLRIHRGLGRREAFGAAVDLLDRVGIDSPARRARAYPHELSGGQRQRAMIAMALACGPDLVIADEPTTALDVTVQKQVLEVLDDQVTATGAALLLITHDLPVVATVCEDVMVMRHGRIVERGPTEKVFTRSDHEYTAALVAAVPSMSRTADSASIAPVSPRSGAVDIDPIVADADDTEPIIVVSEARRSFTLRRRTLFESPPQIHALDGVSLSVRPGETFGVVGESGSGKSTLARLMVGLDRPDGGTVSVAGIDVGAARDLRPLRDVVQMVFQDPMSSLDPRLTVGRIIEEPLRALGIGGDHRSRVDELLRAVSLEPEVVTRYPHEFSGGQRQRIAIARALAPAPSILVADEPVSALDMSVQTVTLDLLARLKDDFALTMVFISHDLSVVHEICDRVVVLQRGQVVETGTAADVLGDPRHDYTRGLVAAVPRLDGAFG